METIVAIITGILGVFLALLCIGVFYLLWNMDEMLFLPKGHNPYDLFSSERESLNNFSLKIFINSVQRFPVYYYYRDGMQELVFLNTLGHQFTATLFDSGHFTSNFKCDDITKDFFINQVFPVFKKEYPNGYGCINAEKRILNS